MNLPRINHVVEDMEVLSGGVPAVVRQLTKRLVSKGHEASVTYCLGDASDLDDITTTVKCPPQGLLNKWSYSKKLKNTLSEIALSNNDYLIHHIHGVWKAPQALAAKVCKKSSIPFIFSIHGMLEPWLWKRQGLTHYTKKVLFWELLAKRNMSNSTIIHAITPHERDNLHKLLPGCDIEIIPNAIELCSIDSCSAKTRRDKRFLFLGRLEPKKGIDILIKAFAHSGLSPEWCLDIVGPSWSDSYFNNLRNLVNKYSLCNNVVFHGALFGDKKKALLRTAWAMVTPSHSEVVGLVNLEAADNFLPSITTYQTGLSDWTEGGGLLISPDMLQLSSALTMASCWSTEEQFDRGVASRSLVEKRYSWEYVMPLWESLYSQIAN